MENQKLFDVMEHWLQGRINTCVSGLFSRIEYLESRVAELESYERKRHLLIRDQIKDVLDGINFADLMGDDLREIVQNELKYVDIPEHLSDYIAREVTERLKSSTISFKLEN